MNKEYIQPDFDVTEYQINDEITMSGGNNLFTENDPDGGEWWG